MAEAFDPYHLWLGIPPEEQPPNHYRLLGIKLLERNADVISSAADRQMAHVRSFQSGKHGAESQKLLNDLSAARVCLLSAEKKAIYDQTLQAQLNRQAAAAAPPPAAPPAAVTARPLRMAQAVAPVRQASAASQAGAPPDPLGFDPLAEDSTPRHRKRKRSAHQPAILAGIAAGLVAVVGLFLGIAGSGRDETKPASQTVAAAKKTTDSADQNDRPQKARDRKITPQIESSDDESRTARATDAADDSPVGIDPEPGDDEPSEPSADSMSTDEGQDIDADASQSPDLAPARQVVPDAEAVKAATAEIHTLLKDEFSAAKKRDQRVALGEKLIALSQDSSAPAERYALLSEVQRLASSAGDPQLALQAVALLAEHFDVNKLELNVEAVESFSGKELTQPAQQFLVEAALPLIDEVAADGQFKLARRLATAALAVARKGNQTDAAKTLNRQAHDLAAQEKLAEAAEAARRQLQEKPGDAEAHLTLGRYLCFVANDWAAGLPHVVQGNDEPLRGAAERELRGATSASDQVEIGDLWWDLAEQTKGADKAPLRARAGYWYEQAVDDLKGLGKAKIDKRLAELSESQPSKIAAKRKKVTYLTDLPATEVRVYPSFDAKVSLQGVLSLHSVMLHPLSNSFSHAAFNLAGRYASLAGRAALNDSTDPRTHTPLTFRIVGDGKQLWKSRAMQNRADFQEFDVSVEGVRKLELFVDCPGFDGMAHAIWFEPQLTLATKLSNKSNSVASSNDGKYPEGRADSARSAAPKSATVYLSKLAARDVRSLFPIDASVSLRGVSSPHGIFLHPIPSNSSHAAYDLDGLFRSLAGRVGINDTAEKGGSAVPLTFRIVGDGKQLWESQPLQRTGDSQEFRISVAKIRELELFVDCPGDYGFAHAVWFEPQLTSANAGSKTRDKPLSGGKDSVQLPQGHGAKVTRNNGKRQFLSDLPQHEVRRYESAEPPLSLAGLPSPHGIFLHPPTPSSSSHVAYDLGGHYQGFAGQVGLNDGAPTGRSQSQLTFRIVGDGRELWKSPPVQRIGEPQEFQVSVADVAKLELFVDCPGGSNSAWAVWFEPRLTKSGTGAASKPAETKGAAPRGAAIKPTHGKTQFLADLPTHDVRSLLTGAPPPLSIHEIPSPHGILLHPADMSSAHTAFDLAGRFENLTGLVGINDTAIEGVASPLTFRIVGDAKELWKSRPLQQRADSQEFKVSVADVRELELFVDAAGGARYGHAVWIEPQLTLAQKNSRPKNASAAPSSAAQDKTATSKLLKDAVLIATFDEGTVLRKKGSTYVRDLSGRQQPGLVVGGTIAKGKAGQALSIGKMNDCVDFGSAPSLSFTTSLSVCAWLYLQNRGGSVIGNSSEQGGVPHGFSLRISDGTPGTEGWPNITIGNSGWRKCESAQAIPLAKWHHLVVTHDSQTLMLYVNGVAVAQLSAQGSITAPVLPLHIGSSEGSPSAQLQGLIDEVALFDRALSAAEVGQIYELGKSGMSLATSGKK